MEDTMLLSPLQNQFIFEINFFGICNEKFMKMAFLKIVGVRKGKKLGAI
jgi:hypothetical protein